MAVALLSACHPRGIAMPRFSDSPASFGRRNQSHTPHGEDKAGTRAGLRFGGSMENRGGTLVARVHSEGSTK